MKTIFLLASVFVSILARGQLKKINDIIGRWDIAGEQESGASLQIIDSSTILLTYNGETKKISNIKIDCSKSPCWFDFAATDTSDVVQVKSIIEKVGEDVIKWQLFIDEERTPYFTAKKGELLYLKKARTAVITVRSN
ncbi:MAG TPA: hypothetical protein VF487_19650 [Chitinophagaceae bacterium]